MALSGIFFNYLKVCVVVVFFKENKKIHVRVSKFDINTRTHTYILYITHFIFMTHLLKPMAIFCWPACKEPAPLPIEICSELALSVSQGLNEEFAAVSPFCPRQSAENITLSLIFAKLCLIQLISQPNREASRQRKNPLSFPEGVLLRVSKHR